METKWSAISKHLNSQHVENHMDVLSLGTYSKCVMSSYFATNQNKFGTLLFDDEWMFKCQFCSFYIPWVKFYFTLDHFGILYVEKCSFFRPSKKSHFFFKERTWLCCIEGDICVRMLSFFQMRTTEKVSWNVETKTCHKFSKVYGRIMIGVSLES